MMELLKKAVLTGLGAVSLTRKKVEEVVAELVKEGELSEAQGRKLVEALVKEGSQQKEEMARKISAAVSEALGRMDVARKSELADLEKRVAALEKGR